ncbi:unnamed protein product [Bursaphelenchus xylophilus]|uniref:(pine wood nematode) hypothetical protein n=1 Tax=Bursaphelenchus xylophilus TaxID=6326 RepID=A0A1I7S7Y1_BURXY|nr:unnamed protein product [Bursaphelenchus xylophilus]CAG9087215.1 unnamed protein product [Bursaphelenchus xylophilus]
MLNHEPFSFFTQYFTSFINLEDARADHQHEEIKKQLRLTLFGRRGIYSAALKNLYALRIRAIRGNIGDVRLGIKINPLEDATSYLVNEHDYVFCGDYVDIIKLVVPVFSGISFQVDQDGHTMITMYGFSKGCPTESYTRILCNDILKWKFKINQNSICRLIAELAPNLKTIDFTSCDNTSYYRVADVLATTPAMSLDRVTVRLQEGCKPSIFDFCAIHRVKHLEIWPCPWKLFLLDKIEIRRKFEVDTFTICLFGSPGMETRFYQVERHILDLLEQTMTRIVTKNIKLAVDVPSSGVFVRFSPSIREYDSLIQRFMSPGVKYTLEMNRVLDDLAEDIVSLAICEIGLEDLSSLLYNGPPPERNSLQLVNRSSLVAQLRCDLYSDVQLEVNWKRRTRSLKDQEHISVKLGSSNGL